MADSLLRDDGFYILREDGGRIVLESWAGPATSTDAVQREDGGLVLREDGWRVLLESAAAEEPAADEADDWGHYHYIKMRRREKAALKALKTPRVAVGRGRIRPPTFRSVTVARAISTPQTSVVGGLVSNLLSASVARVVPTNAGPLQSVLPSKLTVTGAGPHRQRRGRVRAHGRADARSGRHG